MEYSDQKRKGLFKGTALDYVRMRADKHEKVYHDKKQADHLRKLADELGQLPAELIEKIERLEKDLNFWRDISDVSMRLNEWIIKGGGVIIMKKEKRVKKVDSYKTSDGKLYTGPKAKNNAKAHERSIIFRESLDKIVDKARKLFDIPIPKSNKQDDREDDRDQKEIDFMEELTDIVYRDQDFYYLDDFVELIMNLFELNPRAIESLIKFIRDQKKKTDTIEDDILL